MWTDDDDARLYTFVTEQTTRTAPTHICAFLDTLHEDALAGLLSKPGIHPDIVSHFVTHPDILVRGAIAANPGTHPHTLQHPHLALDTSPEEEYVRIRLSTNPATPPETLTKLATNPHETVSVLHYTLTHPNTPTTTIQQLTHHPHPIINALAKELSTQ